MVLVDRGAFRFYSGYCEAQDNRSGEANAKEQGHAL